MYFSIHVQHACGNRRVNVRVYLIIFCQIMSSHIHSDPKNDTANETRIRHKNLVKPGRPSQIFGCQAPSLCCSSIIFSNAAIWASSKSAAVRRFPLPSLHPGFLARKWPRRCAHLEASWGRHGCYYGKATRTQWVRGSRLKSGMCNWNVRKMLHLQDLNNNKQTEHIIWWPWWPFLLLANPNFTVEIKRLVMNLHMLWHVTTCSDKVYMIAASKALFWCRFCCSHKRLQRLLSSWRGIFANQTTENLHQHNVSFFGVHTAAPITPLSNSTNKGPTWSQMNI